MHGDSISNHAEVSQIIWFLEFEEIFTSIAIMLMIYAVLSVSFIPLMYIFWAVIIFEIYREENF
jgi:hypothetical protein